MRHRVQALLLLVLLLVPGCTVGGGGFFPARRLGPHVSVLNEAVQGQVLQVTSCPLDQPVPPAEGLHTIRVHHTPVAGATVSFGGKKTTTDAQGLFSYERQTELRWERSAHETASGNEFGTIYATAPGYTPAEVTVHWKSGTVKPTTSPYDAHYRGTDFNTQVDPKTDHRPILMIVVPPLSLPK